MAPTLINVCYPVSQGPFVPFDGAKVWPFFHPAMFFCVLCAKTAAFVDPCQIFAK
jgi:hypothetical protein